MSGSDDDLWSGTRPAPGRWQPPSSAPPPPPPATAPPTSVGPTVPPPPPGPPPPTGGGPPDGDGDRGRGPWLAIVATVLAAMFAGGAVVFLLVSGDDEEGAPEDTTTPTRRTAGTSATTAPAPTTATSEAPVTSASVAQTAATSAPTVEFTLPPAPTSPTTTAPPTTPRTDPPVDPQQRAAQRLDEHLRDDAPTVEGLQGSWVVQLSAKRPGLEADGIVYEMTDVLANHESLRAQYDAVLLWSGDWAYDVDDLYITVIPTPYADPQEALDVCRSFGFDRENCLAKKITTDRSDQNTTEYLP